jgi:hypothetical protein
MATQTKLNFNLDNGLRSILDLTPYYETGGGIAILGDSMEAMQKIPTGSVSLVLTSPP